MITVAEPAFTRRHLLYGAAQIAEVLCFVRLLFSPLRCHNGNSQRGEMKSGSSISSGPFVGLVYYGEYDDCDCTFLSARWEILKETCNAKRVQNNGRTKTHRTHAPLFWREPS